MNNANSSPLTLRIQTRLAAQKAEKLYRAPLTIDCSDADSILSEGKQYYNFCSNDYLGLSHHTELKALLQKAVEQNPVGSGASRLISANTKRLLEVEDYYGNYFGYETALFFPSGYVANLAAISTLFNEEDLVFYDKEIHASMAKGLQLAKTNFKGFNHNNLDHLEKRLQNEKPLNEGSLQGVIAESCYSMSGDTPNLSKLSQLCQEHQLVSILDEAHSLGVLGTKGKGLAYEAHYHPNILVGTLGKGFGFSGAFLCMSHQLKDYFYNFCNPLIYSTAGSPYLADYLFSLLQFIEKQDDLRENLVEKTHFFRETLQKAGIPTLGEHQIVGISIGDEEKCLQIANALKTEGFLVGAIRFPTVPHQKALLRIGMSAIQSKETILQLAKSIIKHLLPLDAPSKLCDNKA